MDVYFIFSDITVNISCVSKETLYPYKCTMLNVNGSARFI